MMSEIQGGNSSDNFDMQLIGKLLSFASRGDRVGLNLMLMKGTSPDVQDYDNRTALHLAASEGHAPIIELLLHYNANVNLRDRWQRTPLTDARLYGHRDICRILEVNGGKDFINDHPMSVRHEQDTNEVNFDISELHTQQSSTTEQGVFGESEKVKWRGTWVVKTLIKRQIYEPVKMILSAKDNTLLRELRHPNILQFLGSIEQQEGMILITEYLSKGNLEDILNKRVRLDIPITVRYALDIARGMNYLHEHKPFPIVHYHLSTRVISISALNSSIFQFNLHFAETKLTIEVYCWNLLQDEGGHLKVGEYWVQMLYERINPEEDNCENCDASNTSSNPVIDTKKDICSFGHIVYQMLEGRAHMQSNMNLESIDFESVDFKPKFHTSRCSIRIKELIEDCTSKKASQRPTFEAVISILEDETVLLGKTACGVC